MALRVSILAFAVSMGRVLLDWGFVFPEFGLTDPPAVLGTLIVYVALYTGWVLAIVAIATGRRAGLWASLCFALVLNVALGVGTTLVFCPTPCATLWPVGELVNWATTISGLLAVVVLGRSLLSTRATGTRM